MSYRYPNLQYGISQVATEQPVPTSRTLRTNFLQAGVDNYTQAPGQDAELMEVLDNVLPITTGAIQRRPGYSFWMNPTQAVSHMYDYLSDLTGAREVILTSASYVKTQNDDGSSYNQNLFTPTGGAVPRAVVSRSYAYFSDGQSADYKKWDGSIVNGVTRWGIDINDVGSGTVAGPNYAVDAIDVGTGGPSGSIGPNSPATVSFIPTGVPTLSGTDNNWVDPGNASADDGTSASVLAFGGDGNTSELVAFQYNFNVPGTAVITGVVAEVAWGETPFILDIQDTVVQLYVDAAVAGNNYAKTQFVNYPYDGYQVYGSPSDTWGLPLTPAQVNGPNFGLAFAAQNVIPVNPDTGEAPSDFVYVDHMRLTVYYDMPAATASWTNSFNISNEDGSTADAFVTTSLTSALQGTNFQFTVSPFATVAGIEVRVKAATIYPVQLRVSLLKGGVLYGEEKSHVVTSPGLTFLSYGGTADLWSGVWTPSDINNTTFGVSMTAVEMGGTTPLSIDFVTVTVYLAAGPVTLGTTGAGNITLTSGRKYFAAFSNTLSGSYSDITLPSRSTGPLTSQAQNLNNVPVSVDTQVDTVNILATADGGDESRLFLVSSLPNGTTTYTDTMDELTLLNQPVLLSTDAVGEEFGVTNNVPPPVSAIFPTKHRGRLYMLKGPTLYWSKSLTEVTTDTGFIAGRWEECWDPNNSADISEGAEGGRGMLSDGVNLYIGTEFKIRRLNGTAPFLEDPDIVHNEVGIMNQDVWQVTFLEGTPVGAMWLTPDLKIISSDLNTYKDISTPIQSTLLSVNTAVVKETAYAAFYGDGPLNLYMLALPTGTSTVNNVLCIFNLKSQQWFVWKFTDSIKSLLYHVLGTGVPQLLIAATTGKVYQLAPETTQDRVNDTPVPFTTVARTSWLDFTDGTMRKSLNEIEVQTEDPGLMVTVEGASKASDFRIPRIVAQRQVQLSPRGEYKVYLASSTTRDRYYRFTFTSTSTVKNVLSGYNIETVEVNRQ